MITMNNIKDDMVWVSKATSILLGCNIAVQIGCMLSVDQEEKNRKLKNKIKYYNAEKITQLLMLLK